MKKIKDYPRPQLVRDNWQNLNGKWSFIFDDENLGEQKEFFKKFPKATEILVPFTYETKMSGIGDQTVHENIWYNNKIRLKSDKDRRTILHFEGSDFLTNDVLALLMDEERLDGQDQELRQLRREGPARILEICEEPASRRLRIFAGV